MQKQSYFNTSTSVLISGICLIFILLPSLLISDNKKIARYNLQTVTWEDEDWPDDGDYANYLRFVLRMHHSPQPFRKRHTTFNAIVGFDGVQEPSPKSVLDDVTWEDLEILCGKNSKKKDTYLVSCINRAETEVGLVSLLNIMAQPITDVEILRQRQNIVRLLIENEALFDALDSCVKDMSKSENSMISFWFGSDPFRHIIGRHYAIMGPACLKSSAVLLAVKGFLNHQCRLASIFASAGATAVLPFCGLSSLVGNQDDTRLHEWEKGFKSAGGPLFGLLGRLSKNRSFQAGLSIASGLYCGCALKEQVKWAYDCTLVPWCLQHKISHVQRYLHLFKEIYITLQQYGVSQEQMQFFGVVDRKTLSSLSQVLHECNRACALLKLPSSCIKKRCSALLLEGCIVCAYQLIHELK